MRVKRKRNYISPNYVNFMQKNSLKSTRAYLTDSFLEKRQNRLDLRQLLILVAENRNGIAKHLLHESLLLVRVVVRLGRDHGIGLALLLAEREHNDGRHALVHDGLQHLVTTRLVRALRVRQIRAASIRALLLSLSGHVVLSGRFFEHHHRFVEIVFSKVSLLIIIIKNIKNINLGKLNTRLFLRFHRQQDEYHRHRPDRCNVEEASVDSRCRRRDTAVCANR